MRYSRFRKQPTPSAHTSHPTNHRRLDRLRAAFCLFERLGRDWPTVYINDPYPFSRQLSPGLCAAPTAPVVITRPRLGTAASTPSTLGRTPDLASPRFLDSHPLQRSAVCPSFRALICMPAAPCPAEEPEELSRARCQHSARQAPLLSRSA